MNPYVSRFVDAADRVDAALDVVTPTTREEIDFALRGVVAVIGFAAVITAFLLP